MFNTTFLREQSEKAKYRGRGKYKRNLHQYFFDVYKGNEKVESGIAWGYADLRKQRRAIRTRLRGGYRIKVYNNTKGRWLKK